MKKHFDLDIDVGDVFATVTITENESGDKTKIKAMKFSEIRDRVGDEVVSWIQMMIEEEII